MPFTICPKAGYNMIVNLGQVFNYKYYAKIYISDSYRIHSNSDRM